VTWALPDIPHQYFSGIYLNKNVRTGCFQPASQKVTSKEIQAESRRAYGKRSVSKLCNSYPGINKVYSGIKKVYAGIKTVLSRDNGLPRDKNLSQDKTLPRGNYPDVKVIPA